MLFKSGVAQAVLDTNNGVADRLYNYYFKKRPRTIIWMGH